MLGFETDGVKVAGGAADKGELTAVTEVRDRKGAHHLSASSASSPCNLDPGVMTWGLQGKWSRAWTDSSQQGGEEACG